MTPVLIFTDTKRIAAEKATLDRVVTLFQSVYDAFKDISITPTIAEINTLVTYTMRRNASGDWLQDFATNKVINAAGGLVVAGIPLNREKFIQLMDAQPNVSAVKVALSASENTFNGPFEIKSARINLLSLVDDVITKVADSDAQISAVYSYYTKTDQSATIATSIQAVCDTLNAFDASYSGVLREPTNSNFYDFGYSGNLPSAIKVQNGAFVISLDFIRAYERKNAI